MNQFQVGTTYYMRSPGDHNCIWTYKVLSRTEKTVKLREEAPYSRTPKSFRIAMRYETEQVMPLGRFSMAPCLTATKILPPEGVESLQDYRNVMR